MKFNFLLVSLLSFGLVGCSLIPKKVEYFQDKVQKYPTRSEYHEEKLRQIVALANEESMKTVMAAREAEVPVSVQQPAENTHNLVSIASSDLGPPEKPIHLNDISKIDTNDVKALHKEVVKQSQIINKLSDSLSAQNAKFESKLKAFAEKNDENAGKKIEDTGLIKVGYFTQIAIIAMLLFVGSIVIKVIGVLNPSIGVGTKVVSGGIAGVFGIAKKGFSELIEAGESFKKKIDEEIEDPETAEKIKKLFKQAHMEKQSRDTQDVVKKLTN